MSKTGAKNKGNGGRNGKKGGSRPVYYLIAGMLAVVVLLVTAIIIVDLKGRNSGAPDKTSDPVSLTTPENFSTEAPSAATELPDASPLSTPGSGGEATETPSGTPEPTPTSVPTGTPEPTPTPTPVPTPTPTPKPSFVNGETSANPEYAGYVLMALTFDDGPNPSVTNALLDVLAKHGAKATFFVVGSRLGDSSIDAALRRTVAEGHEIGNHTFSHVHLTSLSAEGLNEEIEKTNTLVREISGYEIKLVRAPGGEFNSTVLKRLGRPLIQWSIDSLDYMQLERPNIRSYAAEKGISYEEAESELIDQLLFYGVHRTYEGRNINNPSIISKVRHGAILLCHDLYAATPKLIDRLLSYLEENGNFKFLTVSDLISTESDGPVASKVYYNMWASDR